ncbi:MAG: hypothetical protein J6T28_13205 [Paludibacteraceae bacterium]|nr:hypothetical protein [Paludibacteraceae bacterium]
MKKDIYNLNLDNIPFQMHDQEINRIILTENSIQLCFDAVCSDYIRGSKAILEFFGMKEGTDEVSCSAYLDVYNMKHLKISEGKRLYADEFNSFMQKDKISLIVLDMWVGYGSFMITGKVSEGKQIGDKCFSLVIDATKIEYSWIE